MDFFLSNASKRKPLKRFSKVFDQVRNGWLFIG
jgi:hypothetical protein